MNEKKRGIKKFKRKLEFFFARIFSWSRSIENVLCVRLFRSLQSLMLWFESEKKSSFFNYFFGGMPGICRICVRTSCDQRYAYHMRRSTKLNQIIASIWIVINDESKLSQTNSKQRDNETVFWHHSTLLTLRNIICNAWRHRASLRQQRKPIL